MRREQRRAVRRCALRVKKSPIVHRTLLALSVVLAPAAARADAWEAREVVQRALAAQDQRPALAARQRAVQADAASETVRPVPRFELAYEQVFGPPAVQMGQLSVTVEQSIDWTRWRGRYRRATAHRQAALAAEVEAWRVQVVAAVREAFYATLHRQARVATLAAWDAQLTARQRALEQRHAQGDASALALARLARERRLVSARLATEEALRAEAWASLRRWLPGAPEQPPALVGALEPDAPEQTGAAPMLPELERLAHEQRALEAEAQALGQPGARGWTLGGGYRFASASSQSGHGALLTLTGPLALWSIDAPRQEALRARQRALAAEADRQQTAARRDADAARRRLLLALAASARLRPTPEDARLVALTTTAYEAGEAPLRDLLDAYASDADLALARHDLSWEARRAAVALDLKMGVRS